MFDSRKFKAAVIMRGLTMESVAKKLGINPATLYRKIGGSSDFSRAEIQELRGILGLSTDELRAIFFAEELA